MTTMVLFVGEQPLPNLLPILALKPDSIIAVHTARTKEVWEQRLAKVISSSLPSTTTASCSVDPFQTQMIINELRDHIEDLNPAEVVYNVTGGTKPMSFAGYALAHTYGSPYIYLQTEESESRLYRYEFRAGLPSLTKTQILPTLISLNTFFAVQLGGKRPNEDGFTKERGGRFEQAVHNVLASVVDEIKVGVKTFERSLDIDLIVRCGNQIAVIEAKDEKPLKKGIDQLNTAAGPLYLGTYTRKFLISSHLWPQENPLRDLAEGRDIEIIEVPSYQYEAGIMNPEDQAKIRTTILTTLGKR